MIEGGNHPAWWTRQAMRQQRKVGSNQTEAARLQRRLERLSVHWSAGQALRGSSLVVQALATKSVIVDTEVLAYLIDRADRSTG